MPKRLTDSELLRIIRDLSEKRANYFNDRLNKTCSCWEWLGSTNRNGYGVLYFGGLGALAHRFSYLLHNRRETGGLFVLHKCDNPGCVNPYHLFLGAQADNVKDCRKKNRNARGSRMGPAKLNEEEVLSMRWLRKNGATAKALAAKYGVCVRTVSLAVSGRGWAHVEGPLTVGYRRGEANARAKLTEQQVLAIAGCKGAKTKGGEVAARYGVSVDTVYSIWGRRAWSHLWRAGNHGKGENTGNVKPPERQALDA